MLNKLFLASLIIVSAALLASCDQNEAESKIAKNMTLTITKSALVVPSELKNTDEVFATCVDGTVSGPRVRLRATLLWNGLGDSNNILVPMTVSLIITDDGRVGTYNKNLQTSGERESISILFGEEINDYIAPSNTVYASTICFADFGNLPKPANEITGNGKVTVNATVRILGVMRNLSDPNIEIPFTKEVKTQVVYTSGSVP